MMVPNLLQQKDNGLGRKTENMDVVDSETGHQRVMGDHKLEGGMDVFCSFLLIVICFCSFYFHVDL